MWVWEPGATGAVRRDFLEELTLKVWGVSRGYMGRGGRAGIPGRGRMGEGTGRIIPILQTSQLRSCHSAQLDRPGARTGFLCVWLLSPRSLHDAALEGDT